MRGEAKWRPVWGYFVVAGLLLAAALYAQDRAQGPVTCDSETMRPGDICQVYGKGNYTYEEQQRGQEQVPMWFGLAGAAFALVGLVVGLVRGPQVRKAPDPQAERLAWEVACAYQNARVEEYLATVPPEKREKQRDELEQTIARDRAKELRKRGWTSSG